MDSRAFLKVGHPRTLFAAFLYFDMSFMVWVLLGSLGVAIAKTFHLSPAQKGFMVATPVLAGAMLRIVNGAVLGIVIGAIVLALYRVVSRPRAHPSSA